MFLIEFGKIFRRNFNYLFGLIVLLISTGCIYNLKSISTYYEIPEINTMFNIVLKIVLVLVIFIMGINYIYSYREDHITKVSTLLIMTNKKVSRDISSILASLIYFFVYYLVLVCGTCAVLYSKNKGTFLDIRDAFLTGHTIYSYVLMIILMLLFANLVFLLMISLFNNTNIAIALSLLFFVGGDVVSKLLESRISFLSGKLDNSILNIFAKVFSNLNQNIDLNVTTFLPLVLNMAGLVLVIFVVRLIKRVVS